MFELVNSIKEIGVFSFDSFWFPLLIWTACSVLAFLILHLKKDLNPLFQYHLRAAALLSLPLGIIASFLLKLVPNWISAPELETAFFVINNPIEIVPAGIYDAPEQAILWQEASFFIGLFTLLVIFISSYLLLRTAASYFELRKLYNNLNLSVLNVDDDELKGHNIQLAFHDHPLVPFTFGWKNPVIVLPKVINQNPEKLQMALRHELTHIKRGDYLLQLALSIIESIFWFHPLIHFGTREIDTFREISCDQEVLSKSNFSVKSYANLLYELVPLNSGVGRLSVSMAVHNSTLKKRIKTMKYHKLYKTSFRQSIFFLLLMVVGITLPIACSDLRGPQGMSEEEIIEAEVSFGNSILTVNGVEVINYMETQPSTLNNGFTFAAKQYGLFVISGTKFEGASKTATLRKDKLTFNTNELHFIVSKVDGFFINGATDLWVRYYPNRITSTYNQGGFSFTKFQNNAFESLLPPEHLNPPPPPISLNPDEDLGDYFVVVEEMPQPIGGRAALQSKVQYPEMARRAGIEGSVTVQFIVNEKGDVEHAKVVRGIGGGCDEAALKVVRETKFTPGQQRGKAVRVQLAVSINFKISDADFSTISIQDQKDPPPPPAQK